MNITKYKISDTEYLQINPDECIHEDECQFCTQIDMNYVDTKNNFNLRFVYEGVSDFYYFIAECEIFQKLIEGKHTLDKSITHDAGFEWNEYFANKKNQPKLLNIIGLAILIKEYTLTIAVGYITMKKEM